MSDDEETVSFKGLPAQLDLMVRNFSMEEKRRNFKEVLECAVALHAVITVQSSNERQSIMHASTMVLEEKKELPTVEQFNHLV